MNHVSSRDSIGARPAPIHPASLLYSLAVKSCHEVRFQALFTAQTVVGIHAAFQMFLTAVALVYGIFVANLLLPPRRPLRTLFDVVSRIEQAVLLRDGRSGRGRRANSK